MDRYCRGRHGVGGDLENRRACLMLSAEGQDATTAIAENMQAVRDELQADLEQLIGISQDFGQRGFELRTDLDFESFPLRLRQFDGGARKGVEVESCFGRGGLTGKTDETGDQ